MPVSALAAPTFGRAANSRRHRAYQRPRIRPSSNRPLHPSAHLEPAKHSPRWCQSPRARPCSRSPTGRCPAPQAARPPPEQAGDQPMPGRHVISTGYVGCWAPQRMLGQRGKPGIVLIYHTGCWASSGYSVQGCAQLEQKLRQCMDQPVCAGWSRDTEHALTPDAARQNQKKNNINYHLSRMYPKIVGPHKRD